MTATLRWMALLLAVFAAGASAGTAPPPAANDRAGELSGRLHLAGGGVIAGEIEECDEPGILRWRSPHFVAPFDFMTAAIAAIELAAGDGGDGRGAASGGGDDDDFHFELRDQGMVLGKLEGIRDGVATIRSSTLGRIRVDCARFRRLSRLRGGGGLVYRGPKGSGEWTATASGKAPPDAHAGAVVAGSGTTLEAEFAIPERAFVEVVLSWEETPDFKLAIGTSPGSAKVPPHLACEVWGRRIVACCESEEEIDITTIAEIAEGAGQIRVLACIDQRAGRAFVFSPNAGKLVELVRGGGPYLPAGGIRLENASGAVRLEMLLISAWDGSLPAWIAGTSEQVLHSGGILEGSLTGFDPSTREFKFAAGDKEVLIAEAALSSICFAPRADEPPPHLQVTWRDGTNLCGELLRVAGSALWLECPGFDAPVAAPFRELLSVAATDSKKSFAAPLGRAGRLELDGTNLRGCLAPAVESDAASCLAWQPQHARNAAALKRGASGVVVYHAPPRKAPEQPAIDKNARAVRLNRRLRQMEQPKPPTTTNVTTLRSLHLHTGDKIACEILRIDDEGVACRLEASSETVVVPHDDVVAVELLDSYVMKVLDEEQQRRLLTLPAGTGAERPTHLLYSIDDDILRGRLLSMDEHHAIVEIRQERKSLPRNRIARIVWAQAAAESPPPPDPHPEPPPPAPAPREDSAARLGTPVQMTGACAMRCTFLAHEVTAEDVLGTSELMGACVLALDAAYQIYFGDAASGAPAVRSIQGVRFSEAPKPATPAGGAAGGDRPGLESPLVGKAAPAIDLELLAGKRFRSADAKGKVVVLDFWASWCAPCLRSLPEVDRVAKEFEAKGVIFVAINLQESAREIAPLLERMKLDLTVALDKDGAVAKAYEATSIPQTVIIDRAGVVARLFTGSGTDFPAQLRAALEAAAAAPK
ncbi:MAG: TlpA family protein disulfide reductase [Planctomycetes bacterium]|nr:TlpA family protein disulfide reductase [Planctomycetota bacterium]